MNPEVRHTPISSVFKVNPVELKKYVQKYVEVVTSEGEKIHGTVYTIDPVSQCVILVNKKDDKTCMDIVMGNAIKSITISSSNIQAITEDIFTTSESENLSKEEIELKKQKLKNWLIRNKIPVEENGDVIRVQDALEIHPPYGKEQCMSGNEVILGGVLKLIDTMPEDMGD